MHSLFHGNLPRRFTILGVGSAAVASALGGTFISEGARSYQTTHGIVPRGIRPAWNLRPQYQPPVAEVEGTSADIQPVPRIPLHRRYSMYPTKSFSDDDCEDSSDESFDD